MDYFEYVKQLAREHAAKATVRPYETLDERIRRIFHEEWEKTKEPEL